MELRRILFGYEVVNDTYRIVPGEAAVVRKIYRSYIDGDTFKAISDKLTAKRVVYYSEKRTWNKNMVSRILGNRNYIGNEQYPAVISADLFDAAMAKRNVLGGKREQDSPEIKYFKEHTYCSQCGSRIRRIGKYGAHEKWLCSAGCKIERYIDDGSFFKDVLSVINTFDVRKEKSDQAYTPDADALKKINTVRYMEQQSDIRFSPVKQALFDCVSAEFECCPLNKAEIYTDVLKQYLTKHRPFQSLNAKILFLIVDRIEIERDGSVSIAFINGQTANSDGRSKDNGCITEDNNGD